MKFKHGTRRRALEYEKDWVKRWKEDKTFEKSVENRPVDNGYVFYDGPPFITGVPHHGTLLSSIVKDAVPRYWTMKGKRVERVWGWDTHGLPAENFVEKQLGIVDRRQIVASSPASTQSMSQPKSLKKDAKILFVCSANVGRSQFAEGFYNHLTKSGRASSAGVHPDKYWDSAPTLVKFEEEVFIKNQPTGIKSTDTMAEVGIDISQHQRQRLTEDMLKKYDLIVNIAEKSQTPAWLQGDNVVWWDILDPRGESWDKNRTARDAIEQKVKCLVAGDIIDESPAGDAARVRPLTDEISQKSEKVLDKDGNELPTFSLETYITKARESMVANAATWENVVDRIGRWVDFKGAYKTMDKDFMESVWWAFKQLYDKGKIYEGEKVLMYDTKFATPVSKNEVTMDNDAYQTVTDPSVYVKFKVKNKDFCLLAWTTTPWTLPANTALAVNAELDYVEVEFDSERLILAKDLASKVLIDEKKQPLGYKIVREMKGKELVGLEYEPLFADHGGNAHKVWAADYVSTESGTGIVHLAPIYGEDDFELAKANDIPRIHVLDDNGFYYPEVASELYKLMPWRDAIKPLEVWESNKDIAKGLKKAGKVWKIDYIEHEYPFNPRSKQRIMYRAIPSWFFDIQGSKPLMLEQNENINWFPEHIKHGRFAKNIEQAPDWNLSRDRFWATAMPVWKGDKGTVKVVGSYAELKELSGVELEDYHRPWVDGITFDIDGEHFTRIDKVLDCWFESGSMPFAQFHYPFENKEKFEANYPGDFIVEYVGQVRAWFYYVHAVNTVLFGKEAFKNVITTGTLAGNDGRKMSKSLGNYTDPNELMDKYSADSLRFLLMSSPVLNGEDFSLQDKDVQDVARKLSMVWNMYDFFTMYAEVDGWEYVGNVSSDKVDEVLASLHNPLDVWIVSRLHQLVAEVEENMDAYNIPDALSPILPFIDDASNWYVRRSRRRFWKGEDDGDKNDAYKTLHYVLVRLSYLLAPFTPFLAEELHHNLTGDDESIHLKDWLPAGEVNHEAIAQMNRTRELVNNGLGLRMKKDEHQQSIKVRQPLQFVSYAGEKLGDYYEEILLEELNVKEVRHIVDETQDSSWLEISKTITSELKREGLMREVIRFVQSARKNAGLNVDDRIVLSLETDDEELAQAIKEHEKTILAETLAEMSETVANQSEQKVDGASLRIALAVKAS